LITRRSSRLLLLLALSALTFLPMLGRRDIVTSHEARVVQTARQMAEVGWPWNATTIEVPRVVLMKTTEGEALVPAPDGSTLTVNPWLIPVMNGDIRLQKPPLPYWCTAVLYRLIGYSEFASRIVPAMLGALAVLLVWGLARMLIGGVGAWYAGLVWVSTFFVVDEYRKAMADPYLAFLTLACCWAWIRAARSSNRTGMLGAFYVFLALGTLAKGPIIFLFVPVILTTYHLTYRSRVPRNIGGHIAGAILLLVIALPWPIAVIRSIPNAIELWRFESVGALSDKTENARPWWFYLPNVFLIILPWTPLWLLGLARSIKFSAPRRWFAPFATVVIVFIFSLSFAKKNAYLLPLMPIIVISVADGLRWLSIIPRRRPVRTPILRTTWLAVSFSIVIQAMISVILANKDNARSPRDAAAFAAKLLENAPRRSMLFSRLPDEVTAYLPLNAREKTDADEYLFVGDDRKGEADTIARSISTTPAGTVSAVEPVAIPDTSVKRWKLYLLKISPVERPAPSTR
jgi:4-amino-4-deoxy-L-arabinose transferase-like glycosyltransferase